jgi:cytochrome c oxidase subunit 2
MDDLSKSVNHEEHEVHEGKPDKGEMDPETGADLAGPASPGAVCGRGATDKTLKFSRTVLSGRVSPAHRVAAGGGRQVSVVFVCFVFFVVVALATHEAASSAAATIIQTPEPRIVNVSAERFSFTPSEIRLKPNEPIEFRLKSEDTDHGFRILDTDVDIRIPKRGKGTASVTFRPTREGRYTFECSHICGAGHGFMRGTLIVGK